MTQISVTRALAEVKALNDRIEKATRQATFISVTVGGKVPNGSDLQATTNTIRANLQSVQDLIARRQAVKGAVVRSNAVTEVVINGVTMTVAEAIERKGSIDKERTLLAVLQQQLNQNRVAVERNNVTMNQKLDMMIQTAVGKERKATEEELEAISKPYTASNITAPLDPNGLEAVIAKLEAEINGFVFEVDFVLSEANAKTLIEA
ncbi:hypothetical protein phiPsa267_105 [Pseudomonas phage phiPsa267]|uniref:Tail fiber protein n=6 Tax=Otagovirus TaxID=2560197 RepID=A0A7G9V0T8_9CAUD|nr:tail fiber protein [Pseudomonas phage phiPsa374]YP_010766835.1 hypothetical protein QGX14_gp126 [Pseudomonas phage psageK4]YP_010767025.1 hypothetical protein QGX15_gp127 [Pseudomonas phage psageK4e]YP_010767195.1 hypothetical protein QGX16_gp120 [Pseudomonas phage phiPsa397]YP_010767715.1 hypothetical protein QGX19_gp125 [Pseudomonas phage phiPsa267]YP_010767890.1 hypothetical protein QGX20_gp118 [Pseudomonas phage phiPsa300]AHJ87360.1 hypothetical protein phiPsa374_100 [Pseudomonas phage